MSDKFANFFTPMANAHPYIKVAAEGAAGTGKSWTVGLIAVKIQKTIGSTKPIVVFDTEKAAKFLRPLFDKHGIEGLVKESRTLTDLAATIDWCAAGNADVLIIDSITHVYEAYLEAYKANKSKRQNVLEFQDWGIIKPLWRKMFSDRLVNAPCHILFTGREGYIYEQSVNEETNRKEIVKVGVKMRAEGDTAYEPDLLIRMERFERLMDGDKKEVWREATVVKGRGDLCDGLVIKNPTGADFQPFISFVLGNAIQPIKTDSQPDAGLFPAEEARDNARRDRDVLLERNKGLMDEVAAGTSGAAQSLRLSLMKTAYYGETSETAVGLMDVAQLEEANRILVEIVPTLKHVLAGERLLFKKPAETEAARAAQLGEEYTEDILAAGLERLNDYLKWLRDRYRDEKGAAA